MENLIKLVLEWLRVLTIKTTTKPKLSAQYSDGSNSKLWQKNASEQIWSLVEEAKAKNVTILALKTTNAQITEENQNLRKELNSLKAKYRHDIVEALTEGIKLDDEYRNDMVQLYSKSNLTIQEIKGILETYRDAEKMREEHFQKQGQIQKNAFNFIG